MRLAWNGFQGAKGVSWGGGGIVCSVKHAWNGEKSVWAVLQVHRAGMELDSGEVMEVAAGSGGAGATHRVEEREAGMFAKLQIYSESGLVVGGRVGLESEAGHVHSAECTLHVRGWGGDGKVECRVKG